MSILGGEAVRVNTGFTDNFPSPGLMGLDVESTWLTDRGQLDPEFRVRTVQMATTSEAWVFDLLDEEQREIAKNILADSARTWVSHTDMDVMAIWAALGIDISAQNLDTRMLAIMADPDREEDRDLKTLATKYGMPELAAADDELMAWMRAQWVAIGGKKNAAKSAVEEAGWNSLAAMPAEEWPEVFIRYAGLDAIAARRLAPLLTPATQAPPELLRVDQWLHVRATRQRMAGKRIDTAALTSLHVEATQVTGEAKSKAQELTGGVNINGPKILDWFAEHGVDWDTWTGVTTPSGAPSLAKDNIKLLREMVTDETAAQVVEHMITQKGHLDLLRKTDDLARRLVMHSDGIARIHPLLNPIGATTTARMSSSGPNFQNYSKKDPRMRGLFLPEPGYTLLTIDFDQIELRVVAALAREDKMIDIIKSGGDLHQLTVDELAAIGVEITRDTAKIVSFLTVYGGGASALHMQTGIPLEEANNVIQAFKDRYPSITFYSKYMAMQSEEIRTISNRRLPVTRVKGRGERAGEIRSYANVNYQIQSSSRELLVQAWMDLEKTHPGVVWIPIHDELVLMVPEGEEQAVAEAAQQAMRFDFRGVPISATAVELRDRDGISRWMTAKLAETYAAERAS